MNAVLTHWSASFLALTAWSRASPVLAVVLFSAAGIGWHLPAAFDLASRSPVASAAEQALYLGAGVWFWLQVCGPGGHSRWQTPLRRLALLTVTGMTWTVLGMVLVFGSNVVYLTSASSHLRALTALDDQQLSGGVLWMGMMPALIIAGVVLLRGWLNDEDSDTAADPGRLASSRTWGWPATSGRR